MTATQVRAIVDKLLTNVSQGYFPEGMIAHLIFPELKVKQRTGLIGGYGKQHLRIVNTVMLGKGGAPQVDTRTYQTDSYKIEKHGLFDIVTEEDYDNVEQPFDAEADTTRALRTMLALGNEKSMADTLTSPSVLTNGVTLSGSDQFSDTSSDVLATINAAKEAIVDGSGMAPNKAVMDWKVALKLRYHPQIFDELGVKYSGDGKPLTLQALADALELEQILVATARYNSAKENQTDVLSPVWGKHMVLLHAPNKAAKGQVSAGYRVVPTGSMPRKVYKTPVDNPPESTRVLVTDPYDNLITEVGAAYLITNAIA